MSAPSYSDAFAHVMRPGTAPLHVVGTPVRPARASAGAAASRGERAVTDYVAEFIEVCESAIEVAYGDDVASAEFAPGVAVSAPLPMLLAYLLYLAAAAPDDTPERVSDWYAHVDRVTWERLGFATAPARLEVELAFSLMGRHEHQAPELRSLIAFVEFLAGADMLRGVRR